MGSFLSTLVPSFDELLQRATNLNQFGPYQEFSSLQKQASQIASDGYSATKWSCIFIGPTNIEGHNQFIRYCHTHYNTKLDSAPLGATANFLVSQREVVYIVNYLREKEKTDANALQLNSDFMCYVIGFDVTSSNLLQQLDEFEKDWIPFLQQVKQKKPILVVGYTAANPLHGERQVSKAQMQQLVNQFQFLTYVEIDQQFDALENAIGTICLLQQINKL